MTVSSHNHTNFQARLDYIKRLLVDHLGIPSQVRKEKHISVVPRGSHPRLNAIEIQLI